jgi:hypothetical protein
MAVSIDVYDHTLKLFAAGDLLSDTFKINLYSAFTFTASATTKAGAEAGATQLTTANGYTQDDKLLGNPAVTTVTTDDAKFDADDVSWSANGGDIGPAQYAMVYSVTGTEPLFYIDFGEAKTANTGTPFNITWDSAGILTWTVT